MANYFFDKTSLTIVWAVLAIVVFACGPVAKSPLAVQPALPTPTLDPTFTPPPETISSPPALPTNTPIVASETPSSNQVVLSGSIFDQNTNQPVADAWVSAGTDNTTTNADGRYTLTGLPPGQYVLSVTHPYYDPGLSSILTIADGEEQVVDVRLFEPNTSPYPADPMLTNPLDPAGAPTAADAERLARLQGFTGEMVSIRETKLSGEFLVNYKIGDDIRAAVAEVRHEVWELIDEADRKWWIIKVCGNLASRLPEQAPLTPAPKPLPPMAEVLVDGLVMRECAAEVCGEVGSVPGGERVEVFGCLAHETGDWCEVGWSGGRGWCTGQSLRQLAVAEAVPIIEIGLPPAMQSKLVGNGKIAFVSDREGNPEIYVINADGSNLARLTNHPAQDTCPTWSPDGQQLAFISDRDGNRELYKMNADGSGLIRLTNHSSQELCPKWWPDGQRLAFERDASIYTINADGSNLTRLPDHPYLLGLDWSPDGQRIVFTSWTEAGESGKASTYTIPEIKVIDIDGGNLIQLETGATPTWSPDGKWIAFAMWTFSCIFCADLTMNIAVINVDDGELRNLSMEGDSPTWSPDGQQIAFVSQRDSTSVIKLTNVDGSGLVTLIDGHSPDWSRQ